MGFTLKGPLYYGPFSDGSASAVSSKRCEHTKNDKKDKKTKVSSRHFIFSFSCFFLVWWNLWYFWILNFLKGFLKIPKYYYSFQLPYFIYYYYYRGENI